MELEEVKKYLRVDHNEEDDIINDLILASYSFLRGAGIEKPTNEEDIELYNLLVKFYVSHLYENRHIYETGKSGAVEVPFTFNNILYQLKYRNGEDNETR